MKDLVRLVDPRRVLVVALALAAAGCGESDVLGVHEGRVRFVLSADAGAAFVAPDVASSLRPQIDGGRGEEAGTTLLDGGESGEHEERDHRFFASANVTLSSILARNLDGVLENVVMDLPVTVDVVSMDRGREVVLPEGELPPATYDQIVVVMTQVEGVTHDGTTVTITPPGGGWTAIVPVCPFVVDGTTTTTVALQFMVRDAFKWRDNRFHFTPRFRCGDEDEDPVT